MTPDRFSELVEVYCDGELTENEASELRAFLAAGPMARQRMRDLLRDHVLVRAAMHAGDRTAQAQRVGKLVRALRPTGRLAAAREVMAHWARGRRSIWPRLAVAAMVAVAVGLAWWSFAWSAGGDGRPTVADLQGEVHVATDAVSTGNGGRAALLWSDGTRIELDHRTSIKLEKGIEVTSGSITAQVAPQPAGTHFAIATPDARVAVIGTRFQIRVSDFGTRLDVANGMVEFGAGGDRMIARIGPGQVAVAPRQAETGRLILTSTGIAAIRSAAADGDGIWAPVVDRLRGQLPDLIGRPVVLPDDWSIPDWHQRDSRGRHEHVRAEIDAAVLTTWDLALAGRIGLDPEASRRAMAWLAAWCRPGVRFIDETDGNMAPGGFGRDAVICFELPLLVQAADLARDAPGFDPALEADLTRWFAAVIPQAAENVARQQISFNRVWGMLAQMSVLAWEGRPDAVRTEMLRLRAGLTDLLPPESVSAAVKTPDDLLGRCLAGALIASDIDRVQNRNSLAAPVVWFPACRMWSSYRARPDASPTPIEGLRLSLSGPEPWRIPDTSLGEAPPDTTLGWLLALARAGDAEWR